MKINIKAIEILNINLLNNAREGIISTNIYKLPKNEDINKYKILLLTFKV